jgi:hypothetical protein
MPFKRNEPGCQCCGYGLTSSLGDSVAEILVPGTQVALMAGTNTFINFVTLAGSGARLIGANTEEGKLLVQLTSGAVWQIQAKTYSAEELWSTSTDAANHTLYFCKYYSDWGVAVATATGPAEGMSFDSDGNYIVSPFSTTGTEADPSVTVGSLNDICGDQVGNIYCYTEDDPPLTRINKNDLNYSAIEDLSTNNFFSSFFKFIMHDGEELYNNTGFFNGNANPFLAHNSALTLFENGVTATLSDEFLYWGDVTGQAISNDGFHSISLWNSLTETFDSRRLNGSAAFRGWYRLNMDLSVNTYLLGDTSPNDLLVMYPAE